MATKVSFHGKQVIIRTNSLDWDGTDKLVESSLFSQMLSNFLKKERANDSELLKILPVKDPKEQEKLLLSAMIHLAKAHKDDAQKAAPELKDLFSDAYTLN